MDEDGNLLALKSGKTKITLSTHNGLTATAQVTVLPAPSAVKLSHDHVNLSSGETLALSYTLTKDTHTTVRYRSTNPEIASVDSETGLVTAHATGTAFITVSTLNGKTDCCAVNVNISDEPAELPEGDFEIIFMDIDRNDGILIRCGDEYAFIDSGMYSDGKTAAKFLQDQGVTHLKYYIGTHAHADHVEGAPYILAAIPTDIIIAPHK